MKAAPPPMSNQDISAQFVAARRGGYALHRFPGVLPQSLDEAYRIQTQSIDSWPDEVAGWKIGMVPMAFRDQVGAERLVGPIFAGAVFHDLGRIAPMPVFAGGFAAVEAEYVFRLGQTVRPGTVEADPATVQSIVGALHIGVEIASSPLAAINDLGPMSIISDFGNNAGLIVGDEVYDWRSADLSATQITVDLDSKRVGDANVSTIPGGPLAALAFLVGHCARHHITLPAGTFVSTGAVTGVHQAEVGNSAYIRFGGLGHIAVKLARAAALD